MYDSEDVNTLTQRFLEIIELRKQSKKENNNNFHSSIPLKTHEKSLNRKMTRDEEIKQRRQTKQTAKLLFSEFLKIILDF